MNFDERLDTRAFLAFNIDNYSQEIIFPEEHFYGQVTTGVDVAWTFFRKALSPVAGAMLSYSKIYWKPMNSEGEQFDDYLWMVSPYIGGNWNISDRLRLQVHGGYNFSGNIDLIGFEDDDYKSFYIETLLIIKIAEL